MAYTLMPPSVAETCLSLPGAPLPDGTEAKG
jgi:hypothetical protein